MSLVSSTSTTALSAEGSVDAMTRSGVVGAVLELTKARLSLLVLLTTAAGYVLAATGPINAWDIAWTMIGTALAAACANGLNQVIEVERDRRMRRTAQRPLPSGMLSRGIAAWLLIVTGVMGITILAAFVNVLTSLLALITIVLYVAVYTPLKTRTTLNTLVGAVCGGIPPMIGWCAATGSLDAGAWWFGAILFVWQLPHFFALAWMYREDYARGGFVMLPAVDAEGRLTGQAIILLSLVLVPLAVLPTFMGLAGWMYAGGSIALGLIMPTLGVAMYMNRSIRNARRVFLASVLYLPMLLLLLVIDRGPVNQESLVRATTVETPVEVSWVPPAFRP